MQECGAGLVGLAVTGEGENRRLAFGLPPAAVTPLAPDDIDALEEVLGQGIDRDAAPAIIDAGPNWVVARLSSIATLKSLESDFARCAAFERRLGVTGVSVFAVHDADDGSIEVRSFAPPCGVDEDPVCGSGNGCVAVFRRERGLLMAGSGYVAKRCKYMI